MKNEKSKRRIKVANLLIARKFLGLEYFMDSWIPMHEESQSSPPLCMYTHRGFINDR